MQAQNKYIHIFIITRVRFNVNILKCKKQKSIFNFQKCLTDKALYNIIQLIKYVL